MRKLKIKVAMATLGTTQNFASNMIGEPLRKYMTYHGFLYTHGAQI
jgi:hypothetical protein